jgi:phosphatidyl-myo-inositol dimannoside synthase
MNVLALVSDAFGGHGGIALYNRHLLRAVCEHPAGTRVVGIPRVGPNPIERLPANLDWRAAALGGKSRFVAETARVLFDNRRFDLIIAAHLNLLPVAECARRVCRARIIAFTYGVEAWRQGFHVGKRLISGVDACIAIREYTLERMREWANLDGVKTYILENAIDIDAYAPATSAKRADLVRAYGLEGKRVLLTLSRLDDPQFGVDEVLDALPLLTSRIPNLAYLVVGGGTELGRLREKTAQLGLERHVVFTGKIADADKADHYRLADAFAMPGAHPERFDRYPLRFSFLEAAACGLPVVASRPEDMPDLSQSPLPHVYVDPADRHDVARGIETALTRGPGPVPEELARYAYSGFRNRVHAIMNDVMGFHDASDLSTDVPRVRL